MQFSFNNAGIIISTSNTHLDGSGTINDLVTGSSDGTVIKLVTIKGAQNLTQGMIRFFLYDGAKYLLFTEVPIPANTPTGVVQSYMISLNFEMSLPSGYKLGVTSQNAEKFVITAECVDWTNCSCS
jgi:hypothetical protein